MYAKGFNLHIFIQWLLSKIVAYVRLHPFFSCSLAVHAVILYLLYSYGTYQLDVKALQQAHVDVVKSEKRAQQMDMAQRIDDMKKIKRLLEKSANKAPSDNPDTGASSAEKSPEELLAEAQEMSQSIKDLQQDIKAEDLAKLLDIPKEEALKKIEERLKQEQSAKTPETEKPIADNIKDLEAEARSTLEERKQELEAKKDGTKVELAKNNQTESSSDQEGEGGNGQGKNGNGSNGMGSHGSQQEGFLTSPEQAADSVREMDKFLVDSTYDMKGTNFFDMRTARMPEVQGKEIKKSGRMLGAGGSFAERFYLNSWYVIGPFTGNSDAALYKNPSYPPEELVDLDAVYFGKNGRVLKWQYLNSGKYPFEPPDLAEDAVYYGYTEVSFAKAQDVWMWCGADDDMQVWLNKHLVWAGGNVAKQHFFDSVYNTRGSYHRQWNLTEGKRLVHFQQGTNKLLFKLSNGPNRFGVFASIILTR